MAVSNISAEDIARIVATQTANLRDEINQLTNQVKTLTSATQVTEYRTQTINDGVACTEGLDIIKSLPEFSGKSYVSWREAAKNSMSLYIEGSRKYFGALTILRNKIVGNANDTLTNHGTVLNLEAIFARLDFAYADKRPIHVIDQEMSILRQGSKSLIDYYNEVNQKLTLLINKTIMTHGTNSEITKQLNIKNRETALRTFITGLNPPLNQVLFTLAPADLPNALAKAQELHSNQMRSEFALNFSRTYLPENKTFNNNLRSLRNNTQRGGNQFQNHLRYPQVRNNNNTNFPKPEPMDTSSDNLPLGQQKTYGHNQTPEQKTFGYNKSSQPKIFQGQQQNDNAQKWQFNQPVKRNMNFSGQPRLKEPRINNLNENHFLDQASTCPTSSEQIDIAE